MGQGPERCGAAGAIAVTPPTPGGRALDSPAGPRSDPPELGAALSLSARSSSANIDGGEVGVSSENKAWGLPTSVFEVSFCFRSLSRRHWGGTSQPSLTRRKLSTPSVPTKPDVSAAEPGAERREDDVPARRERASSPQPEARHAAPRREQGGE